MAVRNSTPATLQDAIHRMVLAGRLNVMELADAIGWGHSSLYRAANPCDEANFPVSKLIPAMLAQDDFGPLRHIASRCGFALYKIPRRVGRMKPDELARLQKAQAEAVAALTKFFDGELEAPAARKAIDEAIGMLARGRRAVDHGTKQEELGL